MYYRIKKESNEIRSRRKDQANLIEPQTEDTGNMGQKRDYQGNKTDREKKVEDSNGIKEDSKDIS